jgi:hypothetical protein
MVNGTTAMLRMISSEYNIPYKDLLHLISTSLEKPKTTKEPTTLEFITINGKDYLYKERTNTLYTYDEADPINTRIKYGYLIPETLEVVSTNSL